MSTTNEPDYFPDRLSGRSNSMVELPSMIKIGLLTTGNVFPVLDAKR